VPACGRWSRRPCREVQGPTPTMNGHRKSDSSEVPEKTPNKTAQMAVAEEAEGRELAQGNPHQQNASRMQCRADAHSALERVRLAAARDRKMRFTALLHQVYKLETLRLT
jgi:RNA-directed DNA polymerase